MIPKGSRVADVGTDHGYLPVWLRQQGICQQVIASDIRPGPLAAARASAAYYGTTGIDFRLCPGLAGILPEEVDTVVIAGMSGETMISILEAANWNWVGKRLVLQPMTKRQELLEWLYCHSLCVTEEQYVHDHGRDYLLFCAQPGQEPLPRLAFRCGGFRDTPYARRLYARLERALAGFRQAELPREDALCEKLRILEELRDAYGWNDSGMPDEAGTHGV